MSPDIKELLDPIQKGVDRTQSQQQKIIYDFEESQKAFKEWQTGKDEADKKNQKAMDELIKRAYSPELTGGEAPGFAQLFKSTLRDHYSEIKNVRKGHSHLFEMKGDMTTTASVTGSVMRSYLGPSILPNQIFNFRDILEIVNTDTGLITLPRETTPTGSASRQVTENTPKSQIEAKISMVDFKADYIAGYARISKQMLNDLSFLQTWLPRILLREYFKAENAQLYADLTAVAAGSTTTSATVYAEKLIDWIANLGTANYMANVIIGTFAEWAALLKTTSGAGNAYSVPGGISIDPSGQIRIAGIPYRAANWVAAGKTIVADGTQAVLAIADPLRVEFFEQDQDNVIKNMITVRVECRCVLVVEQPGAFVFA